MHSSVAQNEFTLLNIAYKELDKRWNYQNIISPFYRLYYITGGEGVVSFQDKKLILKPGSLYLVPSFMLSRYACEGFLHQYYIHFEEILTTGISIKFVYDLLFEVPATPVDDFLVKRLLEINPGQALINQNPKVITRVEEYKHLANHNKNISIHLETKGILLQLFARFVGHELISGYGGNAHFTRISTTLQHIHAHFQDELTVKELADLAHLNTDYFSRIFQELVGLRPIPYIHQLRIQKAQHLLLFSDLSQDEVAYAVGFSNRTYFAKVFKSHTGNTAGQYRCQGREV